MKTKYLVVPGYVTSKNDGDRHFIGAGDLMRLYGVNPQECLVADESRSTYGSEKDLIVLRPSYSGNYSLPVETKTPTGLLASLRT